MVGLWLHPPHFPLYPTYLKSIHLATCAPPPSSCSFSLSLPLFLAHLPYIFWGRVLCVALNVPVLNSVDQTGLKLRDSPVCAIQILGLKLCHHCLFFLSTHWIQSVNAASIDRHRGGLPQLKRPQVTFSFPNYFPFTLYLVITYMSQILLLYFTLWYNS